MIHIKENILKKKRFTIDNLSLFLKDSRQLNFHEDKKNHMCKNINNIKRIIKIEVSYSENNS